MRGSTKAEQSNAFAELDAGNTQAAEANDSRAEQRGGVQVVERRGQREDKVSASEGVLRVSARDGIASEGGPVAQILHAPFAVRAGAIGPAEPRHADARAQ